MRDIFGSMNCGSSTMAKNVSEKDLDDVNKMREIFGDIDRRSSTVMKYVSDNVEVVSFPKTKKTLTQKEERCRWFDGECFSGRSLRYNLSYCNSNATAVEKDFFDECPAALRFLHDRVDPEMFRLFCEENEHFVQLATTKSQSELAGSDSKEQRCP